MQLQHPKPNPVTIHVKRCRLWPMEGCTSDIDVGIVDVLVEDHDNEVFEGHLL